MLRFYSHYHKLTGKISIMVFFPVFLFYVNNDVFSNENYPTGSRAAAMGNAASAVSDLWSVYHNQAGLASLKNFQVGVHHENRFMVPEFALQAMAMAVPVRPGTIGVSYTYFGFSSYNESKLGLAFGRNFGERFSAGVQFSYLHTFIAGDYGNSGNITAEGGFIARPADGLFIAAHIYNPSRTRMKTYYEQTIPVVLKFGLAVFLGEKIIAAVETEKVHDRRAVFKAGLEMGFSEPLFLRAGISSGPVQGSFGIGYVFGRVAADIAFTDHQVLGFTPHFTLSYRGR
jgi:hypothetical protein